MTNKYGINDVAFIVVSNIEIREAKIVKYAGEPYTVRFTNGTGGIKVRESRYKTIRWITCF